MTLKVKIYEMEYSVSPGGIDCWEMDVKTDLYFSRVYSDFKTAGEAINKLIELHPDKELEVEIMSLNAYNKIMERK